MSFLYRAEGDNTETKDRPGNETECVSVDGNEQPALMSVDVGEHQESDCVRKSQSSSQNVLYFRTHICTFGHALKGTLLNRPNI